jgi:hypothetical protein
MKWREGKMAEHDWRRGDFFSFGENKKNHGIVLNGNTKEAVLFFDPGERGWMWAKKGLVSDDAEFRDKWFLPEKVRLAGETALIVTAICPICNDTGVDETGNNDLPCKCSAGDIALFNVAGVEGQVTGKEIREYFLNNSPRPIELGSKPFLASEIPGRKK